jgi:hypothetical protein
MMRLFAILVATYVAAMVAAGGCTIAGVIQQTGNQSLADKVGFSSLGVALVLWLCGVLWSVRFVGR